MSSADEIWTVGRLLEWTTQFFKQHAVASPRLDAEILLSHVLACPRIELYTLYDGEVSVPDRAQFRDLVKRRAAGCPPAYLIGWREFYGIRFNVTPAVLIPRPETEHLVEAALAFAAAEPLARFLDIGTGSGAIAVAIAKNLPEVRGWAVDLSPEALAVARNNAETAGVADRIAFATSDLFANIDPTATFDLIVSNPPYVTTQEWERLNPGVRDFEPHLALDGGKDGLDVIRRLVEATPRHLRPGGRLYLEIGETQSAAATAILASSPHLVPLPVILDLAKKHRVVGAKRR